MTSVVDTTVKWYTSDQAGLPTLSGTAGALLGVLDLLVNGHSAKAVTSLVVSGGVATLTFSGTHPALVGQVVEVSGSSITALNGEQKVTAVGANTVSFATAASNGTASGTISFKLAGAGWAWQFTGTNLGVLRSASPERHGQSVRFDDTNAQAARVVAYESMSDVNTGTNPFPTSAQQSGGGYWWKSSAASAAAVKWVLVADHRFFYLWAPPYSHTGGPYGSPLRGFGDLVPLTPSGDIHATALGYSAGTSVGTETGGNGTLAGGGSPETVGIAIARAPNGTDLSPTAVKRPYSGLAGTNSFSGVSAWLGAMIDALDGGAYPSRVQVPVSSTANAAPRAELPGLLYLPQSGASSYMATLDTLDGRGEFQGRTLLALLTLGNIAGSNGVPNASIGAVLIDITGPWR